MAHGTVGSVGDWTAAGTRTAGSVESRVGSALIENESPKSLRRLKNINIGGIFHHRGFLGIFSHIQTRVCEERPVAYRSVTFKFRLENRT